MYPILTTLVVGILLFGLVYTIYKASRQAQIAKHEKSEDGVIGKIFWIYVAWAVVVFGGIIVYAIYRL